MATETLMEYAAFLRGWSKGKEIVHTSGCTYKSGRWATKLSNVSEEEAKAKAQELIDAGYATGTTTCFKIVKDPSKILPPPPAEVIVTETGTIVKEKESTMSADRKNLIKLAETMNAIMKLDPPIETKPVSKKGLSDAELLATILETGKELEADDFIAKEGFTPFTEEDATFMTSIGILVPKKPAPIEKTETGRKVRPEAKKTEAGPRYTRATAFADALKSGETDDMKKLIKVADDLYVKHDGKSNPKEATWYQNVIVPGLIALGVVEVKEGKIKLLKK